MEERVRGDLFAPIREAYRTYPANSDFAAVHIGHVDAAGSEHVARWNGNVYDRNRR